MTLNCNDHVLVLTQHLNFAYKISHKKTRAFVSNKVKLENNYFFSCHSILC